MKRSFPLVQNSEGFVDKVDHQMILLKQKRAGLGGKPDIQ